jgi:hypothetical protein
MLVPKFRIGLFRSAAVTFGIVGDELVFYCLGAVLESAGVARGSTKECGDMRVLLCF